MPEGFGVGARPPKANLKGPESAAGGDSRQEDLPAGKENKVPCGGQPCQVRFKVAVPYPDKQEYHFQELFYTLTSRSIIFSNLTTPIKIGNVWHKPLSKLNRHKQGQCCEAQTQWF